MITWTHTRHPFLPLHTLTGHLGEDLLVTVKAADVPPGILEIGALTVEEQFRGDHQLAEDIYAGMLQYVLDLGYSTVEEVLAWTLDESTMILAFGRVRVRLTPDLKEALDRYFQISQATIDWAIAVAEGNETP